MHVVFLLLINGTFILATDIPWASNHRFDEEDEQFYNKQDHTNSTAEGLNEQLPLPVGEIKGNNNTVDRHEKVKNAEYMHPWNLSKDTDRIQFQVEGHEGPQTYIYGFDTGYGKNRQYRLEERHRDGTVKGQYGYYDAKGKLRRVKYVAKPFEGYTEIHHESNVQKPKN